MHPLFLQVFLVARFLPKPLCVRNGSQGPHRCHAVEELVWRDSGAIGLYLSSLSLSLSLGSGEIGHWPCRSHHLHNMDMVQDIMVFRSLGDGVFMFGYLAILIWATKLTIALYKKPS